VRQKSDQTKKPAQPTAAKGSTAARVKAATYDGTSSWLDYKSHFDACSRINQWSENEKGLYLAVALRGQTQSILGDLSIDKQQDYKSLVKALEERFAPPNQTELFVNLIVFFAYQSLISSCLSDLLFYQIPCQQYCLLQFYVNMSGLPSPFAQLY
jgi:hypothetical protein